MPRGKLPNQTIANAFVICRVPESMPIDRRSLLLNLSKDIDAARKHNNFEFATYSRRATADRTLNFLLERRLLSEERGLISRNDRTKRYMARLRPEVTRLLDELPICDPLTLLAGARPVDKQ